MFRDAPPPKKKKKKKKNGKMWEFFPSRGLFGGGSVPFDMYYETDFGSEKKSIGSIIFRLKLKHESMYFLIVVGGVNIFLTVSNPCEVFSLL